MWMRTPTCLPQSLVTFLDNSNFVLTGLFTIEVVLKLFGLGFWDYIKVGVNGAAHCMHRDASAPSPVACSRGRLGGQQPAPDPTPHPALA